MKKKLLAVLCVCALLFACTAQAAEINYGIGYVSQVLTYFRKAPSTSAGYYTQLDKGTRVLVTGSDGAFYKVTYNGQNGYIMKSCVSDTPVAA
ncbi:MAG: SH3 domain-containing protein, partial [Clostridia bacterium]|nr:SH3 domain-containing protein [Clostridia bacterium]